MRRLRTLMDEFFGGKLTSVSHPDCCWLDILTQTVHTRLRTVVENGRIGGPKILSVVGQSRMAKLHLPW